MWHVIRLTSDKQNGFHCINREEALNHWVTDTYVPKVRGYWDVALSNWQASLPEELRDKIWYMQDYQVLDEEIELIKEMSDEVF